MRTKQGVRACHRRTFFIELVDRTQVSASVAERIHELNDAPDQEGGSNRALNGIYRRINQQLRATGSDRDDRCRISTAAKSRRQ
jgi:hypothetical protein